MIGHVVMWKLHDAAKAGQFRSELEVCRDIVPGMLDFTIGTCTDGLDATCDVVLVSTFADEASLRAYIEHPTHVAVSGRLASLRSERHVVDFAQDGA